MLERRAGDLVGRAAELGRLLGLLDQAAAGQPVVALVSGDAGVGKTRLAAELCGVAAQRGFTVLSGRCAELGDSLPYLPLADALRSAAPGPSAASLLDALAARPILGQLLPDRSAAAASGAESPGMAQQQLFGAVLGMLAELADSAPVLLVLEDLHWADRSTRDLLTFLSRVLHRERVALVGTYRTDDLHRGHPLRAVAAELVRLPRVTAVELGPLSAQAMADHLRSLAPRRLEAAELEAIIQRAEGNAYYAEELLAAAADGCSDLPAGLAELLLDRVQRLSPEAQQVLRAAAVAGRRVDDDTVMAASGQAPAQYDLAIREAVASQLLVPDGDQGYTFRHALLREAVYADLLPGERTRLHARLAELLADEVRLSTVPGTAAALAHHSLASHDVAGAFAASVRAGHEAERLAAPAESHRHYDQALALWERVSDPEKLAGLDRGRLAFESATSAAASGDVARAVQQLRRLLGFLADGNDPVLLSQASERLAYLLVELGEHEAAVHAARAAIDALPEEPARWERARALATYVQALMHTSDQDSAPEWAQRALAAARAAGSAAMEADVLVSLGQLEERACRTDAAIELFTSAYRQSLDGGLHVALRAAFQKARAHLERGDLDDASAAAHAGLLRAESAGLGLAPFGLDLQYLHYLAHYNDGDWDHAQQLADGFPVRVTGPREAVLSAMALFIDVARGSPAVADRRTWLEPFWPVDGFSEYLARGLLAEHALWQGDIDAAVTDATAAISVQVDRLGGPAPQLIRVAAVGVAALADRASRARAGGDEVTAAASVEAARAFIEAAREGAAFRRRPAWVLGVDGRAWLARAEAEWLRAQGANDPGAWQAVLAEFGPAFVYETARTRWRLAEALIEAGRRDEAEREWRLAVEVADRLGARPLRSALTDLGRRSRLSSGSNPAATRSASALRGLTAREAEVLRLLAAGRSNREIAAELFIAPKTASVHVSNILAKLGAASRTEAAAIAYAEGVGLAAGREG